MSIEALRWALEQAPVPPLTSGKPNGTAAMVLTALAWHADKHGTGVWPSIERLQLEARVGATAVRAALAALEKATLIVRDGHGPGGTVQWRLELATQRAVTIKDELAAATETRRAADRERQHKRRHVTPPSDVTARSQPSSVTSLGGVTPENVTSLGGVMSHHLAVDVTPPSGPEQSVNLHPTVTGGTLPPDPLRPIPPQAPGSNGQPVPDQPSGPDVNPSPKPSPPPRETRAPAAATNGSLNGSHAHILASLQHAAARPVITRSRTQEHP